MYVHGEESENAFMYGTSFSSYAKTFSFQTTYEELKHCEVDCDDDDPLATGPPTTESYARSPLGARQF